MQVIFLENIKNVGRKGEVKNVANGYFLNFLKPKNFAVVASKNAIEKIEKKRAKEVMNLEKNKEEAKMVQEKLSGLILKYKGKTNGSHLYASVTTQEIIELVLQNVKIRLDKSNFPAGLHLKDIGEHQIEVKLPQGLSVKLKLIIEGSPV